MSLPVNCNIHLVTGGARSGKSGYGLSFIEGLATKFNVQPRYLATAKRWDEDFSNRINRHIQDRSLRPVGWQTVEEPMSLSSVTSQYPLVLIDCVTLWLANVFERYSSNLETSLAFADEEIARISQCTGTFVLITNEIGMGVHADTSVGRRFVDLQGWVNQNLAKRSKTLTLLISGQPLKVKWEE